MIVILLIMLFTSILLIVYTNHLATYSKCEIERIVTNEKFKTKLEQVKLKKVEKHRLIEAD